MAARALLLALFLCPLLVLGSTGLDTGTPATDLTEEEPEEGDLDRLKMGMYVGAGVDVGQPGTCRLEFATPTTICCPPLLQIPRDRSAKRGNGDPIFRYRLAVLAVPAAAAAAIQYSPAI